MEALGHSVVFSKAPHTRDGLSPFFKCICQSEHALKTTLFELLDQFDKAPG